MKLVQFVASMEIGDSREIFRAVGFRSSAAPDFLLARKGWVLVAAGKSREHSLTSARN